MRTLLVSFLAIILSGFFNDTKSQTKFEFPELPYGYDALESFIDKETMEIHYTRHHKAYFNNFVKRPLRKTSLAINQFTTSFQK